MVKTVVIKPLGLVLRQAGLVSSAQVEKALKESPSLPKCRLGERLAIEGCIKPETADFFAEIWPYIIETESNHQEEEIELAAEPVIDREEDTSTLFPNSQMSSFPQTKYKLRGISISQMELGNAGEETTQINPRTIGVRNLQPLGQYLKAASLIDESQIEQILQIQKKNSANFGKIAVERGIISQQTLDFFLQHLNFIKTGEAIAICPKAIALEIDRIESYLLHNQKCEPRDLLQTYSRIRQQRVAIAQKTVAERELLASGIITLDKNVLQITKPIYRAKFDEEWLEKELANLEPYNQIRLKMFDLDRKAVIPYKVLNAVDLWSNRQPFLTQKLYQLIQAESNYVLPGEEETVIEELVYKHIIENWKNGVAAKHFQTISERIMLNQNCSAESLLKSYKKIWQLKEINANNSHEQTELLRIGLIKLKNNRVSISNLIYQAVFNLQWIEEQLKQLKPPQFSALEAGEIKILTTSRNITFKNQKYLWLAFVISLLIIPLFKILFNKPSQPENLEPELYLEQLPNKLTF